MKRCLCMLLLFAALLPGRVFGREPLRDGAMPIEAPSAILMEQETGTVLYEKNADERMTPASVTKVMTLLLITEDLEAGKIRKEDLVTASRRAASFGGSCVYLEEGEQMSVDEMLKCIAVVSANDCAVAMAEHLSGTEELFVARMNQRAEELGLGNTHFTNCTGLFDDDEHYSCARDIALMSRELMRHKSVRDYTTIWMDSIRDGAFELVNTNKLVNRFEGCTGLKTGFTSKAMYCLSATAQRDGTAFIAVILHGETSQKRFDAARTLLDYAFANYTLVSPLTEELSPVAVELGEDDTVTAVCGESGRILVEKAKQRSLTARAELPECVNAPVEKGQRLGTLTISAGEETVAEIPLVAAQGVERLSLGQIWLSLVRTLCGAT